ncbi:hypothetical protein QCA50_013213 [Cerrena zonata]|uniref:Uncharacterized protein n=1 Tax=Cerrena zonata TaxID=2478898 RepID=A0AAW0FWY8_9APHY
MKFTLVAALALGTTAYATPSLFEARQSTCSISSGCNCFTGTITVLGAAIPVDTCTGDEKCEAAQSPVAGTSATPLGNAVFSIAEGACST